MGKKLYSFFSSLGDVLELPATELLNESSAYLCGRRETVFYGVRRVIRCKEDCVSLRLCDCSVNVSGKGLVLSVYGKNAALIRGEVSSICFEGDE